MTNNNYPEEEMMLTPRKVTEYLQQAMDIESSLYTLQEARKKAQSALKSHVAPTKRNIEVPQKESVEASRPHKPVPPKEGVLGTVCLVVAVIFGLATVFFLGVEIADTVRGYPNVAIWIVGIAGLGVTVLFFILWVRNKKKNALRLKQYTEEIVPEYEQKIEAFHEREKQAEERFEQAQKEYKKQVEESEREYSLECQKEQEKYDYALSVVREFDKPIQETKNTLERLYSIGYIYPKYRNMVAVCTMYEYFASGRVSTLTGPDGAYNLYEAESRQDIIINSLDKITIQLEQIKASQYALYTALEHTNSILYGIGSDVSGILNATQKIASYERAIAQATHVTACCAQATEKNTEALKYISLVNG